MPVTRGRVVVLDDEDGVIVCQHQIRDVCAVIFLGCVHLLAHAVSTERDGHFKLAVHLTEEYALKGVPEIVGAFVIE